LPRAPTSGSDVRFGDGIVKVSDNSVAVAWVGCALKSRIDPSVRNPGVGLGIWHLGAPQVACLSGDPLDLVRIAKRRPVTDFGVGLFYSHDDDSCVLSPKLSKNQ